MESIASVRLTVISAGLVVAFAISGCHGDRGQSKSVSVAVAEQAYAPNADSVGFDIVPVPGAHSASEWIATYQSEGKTAKFRIVLEAGKSMGDATPSGPDIQAGSGKFVAEQGSDSSVLLMDLKKALQAKRLPKKVKRAASLPFELASFGDKQSRFPDGGFTGKPAGNWTPMKIFIGEGERESEVFLNLNPVLGKGEFAIKDVDYGDSVLAALATVL
jgi:hypothetical protein